MKETDAIIELIQRTARMAFIAIVIGLLIMLYDPGAVWALPLGAIIGLCSEAKALTSKKKQLPAGEPEWKALWNSESELAHWEIWHDNAEKSVILHYVPEEDYSEKDKKIALTYEEFEDLTEFINRISKIK
ncbi:MAG: hypothetical protein AABY15_02925 [Nanoarchaeota archaeon]